MNLNMFVYMFMYMLKGKFVNMFKFKLGSILYMGKYPSTPQSHPP
jgi:hypothetical protein